MKGSIQKRTGERGTSWYGKYDYLDPVSGKRVHRRISAPTRKECESKLRAAIAAAESGRVPASDKQTVREFVGHWLTSIEHAVRPSTHRRYADVMHKHVIPVLGAVQLSKLAPPHLQELYASRLNQGLSPTTVNHLHVTLHGALKQALRWGMIDRNPCDLVDPPRPSPRKRSLGRLIRPERFWRWETRESWPRYGDWPSCVACGVGNCSD